MRSLPPPTDATWQARAACQGRDIDLFFDEAPETREAALRVCTACPVRTACFDAALATPERFGIWGGATPNARSIERRRRLRGREPRYPAPPTPPALPAKVASIGAVRRLQALRADGHGITEIGEAAGCSRRTVSAWCLTERTRIDRNLALSIERAYRDLAGQAPTPARGTGLGPQARRERAAARGWVPRERWAGIDIDDPAARPAAEHAAAAA